MAAGDTMKAVLCGDLNMVRCFAGDAPRRAGLPIEHIPFVTVSTRADDVTFSSRHVHDRAVIADPARAPEETVRDLVTLAGRLGEGERPALFYGTDAMLLCISRNREELARHYRFSMPPAEIVEDLADKARFARLASELGLPVPATVTSSEARTADDVLARISLPCALKPASHTHFRKSAAVRESGGRPRKALFARSRAELEARLDLMRRSVDAFVVQSYVPGGDDNITSFHAWVDAEGEVAAHYVGRKIRTYPAGSGESTFIELDESPDVTRVGLDVVRALGIAGVVKLDFKRDAWTGELRLLEANPRFNLWNHLGAASGVNLPLVAYAELAGLPPPRTGPVVPGRRWLAFEGDLRAFLGDYGPNGELSLRSWLASYRGKKIYDVFAWDDPVPAAISILRRVGQRASRVAGKAARS
jgi:D-aspartate ligase